MPDEPSLDTAQATQRLTDLTVGRMAAIRNVEAPEDDRLRLASMGVCQGRRVEMVKAGDPLIIRVVGTRVGLSSRLAAYVTVEPCPIQIALDSQDVSS